MCAQKKNPLRKIVHKKIRKKNYSQKKSTKKKVHKNSLRKIVHKKKFKKNSAQ